MSLAARKEHPEEGGTSRRALAGHLSAGSPPWSVGICRVLIIEADPVLSHGLRQALEFDGHVVRIANNRQRGLSLMQDFAPQALIVSAELMRPGDPDFLEELRREQPGIPTLVIGRGPLAAPDLPSFRLGIDQFLLRPVSSRELYSRIEGMLGRVPSNSVAAPRVEGTTRFGEIEVNPLTRVVLRAGREVELRPREFDLLMALVRRRGQVVSRMELLRDVWGNLDAVTSRTVDVHIVQLRRRLERNPRRPEHIVTVRPVGYRLDL
jgi:two-component system, OmpR family, alkaline phosphatase synthesis response regulator PhoP